MTEQQKITTVNKPILQFTPYAWSKLLYMRDKGHTEVGGFAITDPANALLVTDFKLVKQVCSSVSCDFEDIGVADHFDDMADACIHPENCGRIWVHTHPGNSATPSYTDHDTFTKCFGKCSWAIMFILAKGGAKFAQLRILNGAKVFLFDINIDITYEHEFLATDYSKWNEEYLANVKQYVYTAPVVTTASTKDHLSLEKYGNQYMDTLTLRKWFDNIKDGKQSSYHSLEQNWYGDGAYGDLY